MTGGGSTGVGPRRIVSGGQTGVDRAGLDAAMAVGLAYGGWCPAGRLAEDGTIPGRYELAETGSTDYTIRTEQNVVDSDATLILYEGKLRGGTLLTRRLCRRWRKPVCLVRLDQSHAEMAGELASVRRWMSAETPETLNVAGPRESSSPGIHDRAFQFLLRLLEPGGKRSGTGD